MRHYYYNPNDDGTNNQDLRNIACQLAWYIWTNYTSVGLYVRIVTHSMGGLIIRWALDQVARQNIQHFPRYLNVPEVIQIAAPNGGIPAGVGQLFACNGCTQGNNMGQGSDMMNTLQSETVAPSGSYSVPTDWTVMSSYCDRWEYLGVDYDNAMTFPPGTSTQVVHKIMYYDNVLDASGNPINVCASKTTSWHTYKHGDYLYDGQMPGKPYYPATAAECDNCSGDPLYNSAYLTNNADHSSYIVFLRLSTDARVADRIGYVDTGHHFYVKEGALNAPWSLEANNATAIALSGDRIGILQSNGNFSVKEGALNAQWSLEATGGTAIALSGDRIGILQSNGNFSVKEGALNAQWSLEANNAIAIALPNAS